MTRRSEDELAKLRSLLREHGVKEHRPEPEPVVRTLTASEEALYARIVAEAKSPARRRWHRLANWFSDHRGLAVAAVGGLAALALVAVSIPLLLVSAPSADAATPPMLNYEHSLSNDPSRPVGVPAAADLSRLAAVAARQPDQRPADPAMSQHVGSYGWYMTSDWIDQDHPVSAIVPSQIDQWLAPDGSILATERRSNERLDVNGHLIAYPAATPLPSIEPFVKESLPPGETDPGFLATLSRDPVTLRTQLLDWNGGEPSDTAERTALTLMDAVERIHEAYVVPPALESAFWAMLAGESPLRSLGTVTDRGGTTGTAIAYWLDETHQTLKIVIISGATGYFAAIETISFDNSDMPDLDVPAVVGFTDYHERNWEMMPAHANTSP